MLALLLHFALCSSQTWREVNGGEYYKISSIAYIAIGNDGWNTVFSQSEVRDSIPAGPVLFCFFFVASCRLLVRSLCDPMLRIGSVPVRLTNLLVASVSFA